jgi:hypothetical protein
MDKYWDILEFEREAVHLANRVDLPTGGKIHTIVWIDYGKRTATLEVEIEGPAVSIMQFDGIITVTEAEALTGWSEDTQEAEWDDYAQQLAEDMHDEQRAEARNSY